MIARFFFAFLLSLFACDTWAQRFYNLTADEVRVDSVLPIVSQDVHVSAGYIDSTYTAEILYPEFIDMSKDDIANYLRITGMDSEDVTSLPSLPAVDQAVIYNRKQPVMLFSLTPIVYRDSRLQYLVSFMLKITSKPIASKAKKSATTSQHKSPSASDRYADHSVLATGRWAKISVPSTGYYELTQDVIRKAGFTDINKVRVYGYGGNLVPEVLSPDYISTNDDLQPVDMCTVNGHHIFYAKGPVSNPTKGSMTRTRNPYSNAGCYFITENAELQDTTVEAMAQYWKDSNEKHYTLFENDGFAWFKGGRNLVDNVSTSTDKPRNITIAAPKLSSYAKGGTLAINVTANVASAYTVSINDSVVGKANISIGSYDKASASSKTYRIKGLKETNAITLTCNSGGPLRLDYAMLYVPEMESDIDLNNMSFPAAEYVYNITNQDHHADSNVDMVIIIPTSQKYLGQAERLKKFHEEHDGLTVNIVPADELYNEFSSGTPDVSAYRRYMKMLYDRADSTNTEPKYLLLFGGCVWDNRLMTSDCRAYNADDLLLCYESESSYNEISCFVSDDFIGMLDDNEAIMTGSSSYLGTPDIGIGRFPVSSLEEAKIIVDKTIAYANNANVGSWQNTIMFMGDDGNDNLHMRDVNIVAEDVISDYPGFNIRKVMWDSYTRVESTTGNRYPEVESIIRKQQSEGALIMDYAGHGSASAISHEYVLRLSDVQNFTNANLPLWITASCDVGPFDGVDGSIGESIVTNSKGGGFAFYGTTRTVYANYNKHINDAFVKNVLKVSEGRRTTLGDASRMAKTYLVTSGLDRTVNKLQYTLLGDPAVTLNVPTMRCVIDSINGVSVTDTDRQELHANSKVHITGHIDSAGAVFSEFSGLIHTLARDNREKITCFDNEGEATNPFVFYDRSKNLYSGTDSVSNGRFNVQFVIPRDINYSGESGLITLFAYTNDGKHTAHGESEAFTLGGSETIYNDSIGPSIYCYLNSPSFQNGGDVNSTPYFVAEINDNNGINASGSGIGHDLQLVIDNDNERTYNLNDNFRYDFGSYTSGSTYYYIPELPIGIHTLRFRAWDILNNPSTTTLTFNVAKGIEPNIVDVNVTRNPAKTSTAFIVTHDRPGAPVDIDIEIFDASGRLLHRISQTSVPGSPTSTVNWDLTADKGGRLQTGIYLYRVNITCDGSARASKAKKLVVAE